MGAWDAIGRAFLLGISTGLLCLGTCAPVLLPVLLSEERKGAAARWRPLLEFLAGRLAAYLLVGSAAGAAGGALRGRLSPRLAGLPYVAIGLFMMAYGIARGFPELRPCRRIAPLLGRSHPPLVLGLFLGFSLCPPFLAALTDVIASGRPSYGVVFFAVLYLVTSAFLLPLWGAGGLGRDPVVRAIAQLAAVIAGFIYLVMGVVRTVG
jgi:sulfite exporter TauE/SafE